MEQELEQLEGIGGGHHLPERGQRLHRVRGIGRRCASRWSAAWWASFTQARASSAGAGTRTTPPMADSSTHRSARPICPKTSRPSTPSSPAGRCPTSAHGRRIRSLTSSARRRWRSSPTTPPSSPSFPGISADKADRIQQEFKRMFGMRELIAYLAQFEISPRRAMEVFTHLRRRGPCRPSQSEPLSALRRAAAAGLPPRRQHRPVLPDGRGLRPAAGSRPAAHLAPQRGQRPHLSAPGAAAGNGIELHPPAPRKAGARRWISCIETGRTVR